MAAPPDVLPDSPDERPTNVRRRIIAVTMVMAFILYLDRICLAEIVKSASFRNDTHLTPSQTGTLLGIFFFSYAICQLPTGWISDRLGPRQMLTGYIVMWSLFTAFTGMVTSFPALLAMRLLCAASEAGAYPASNAVIRCWIPLKNRARANSLVLVGGRLGGTLAPFLTAWMVASLGNWRLTLWVDGAVGLIVAAAYWSVVRNRPADHPGCNAAERALIGEPPAGTPPAARELGGIFRSLMVNRNLWLCSLMTCLVAVGSAFLITWLPTYLKEQRHVEDLAGGRMVTLVLACGMLGQLTGGWLADFAALRFGLKWGRIFALSVPGVLAGSGYIGCLFVNSATGIIACCSLVAFAADMGNPALWAVAQETGGRVTGIVFGWLNMWSNFGAAAISLLVPLLVAAGKTSEAGQNLVFSVCAGALFISALLPLGLVAIRPLVFRAVDGAKTS
ncbi:MAG: MFS transporter [Opitutus sp.]|nr:MFS transporter [Opitutus sp.]